MELPVKTDSEMLITAYLQWRFMAEIAVARSSARGDMRSFLDASNTAKLFMLSAEYVWGLMTDEERANAESLMPLCAETVYQKDRPDRTDKPLNGDEGDG